MKRKSVIYSVAALIAIVGVVLGTFIFSRPTVNPPLSGGNKTPPAASIDITDKGFVPATLRVAPGTSVVWTNKTSAPHGVASDPYPDRSKLPGLDSRTPLAPEATYSFTFKDSGSWSYHDHLNPTMVGTVVVQ